MSLVPDYSKKVKLIHDTKESAIKEAKRVGDMDVILSQGRYYVEKSPAFVRCWEELVYESK